MNRYTVIFLLALALVARAQDEPAKPAEPKRAHATLTDEQRAEAEQRINDAWNKLPLESKLSVMRLHRAFTQLPAEERRFINERIKSFMDMSPEERQRMRENAKRWQTMSLEERQKAREQFRQRRQEFEQKWRQEHPGEEPPPFPPRPHKPPPPPSPENPEPETENQPKENP
jgi:hypothetical protein